MTVTFELTIQDIIQKDSFRNSRVIAGANGLSNKVRWTHILETNKFESLINGYELILTTGAGLRINTPDGTDYINSLIDRNVAGICIELGTHINHIAKEIIEVANQSNFPIIVFDQFVKFVDITQELHSIIINKHHDLLHVLNDLSMTFNKLSLLPNGILKILEELYTFMDGSVVYITKDAESFYYPPEAKKLKKHICTHVFDPERSINIRSFVSIEDKNVVIVPTKGSRITWGYLCLQVEDNAIQSMLLSVLDQAALAIAQIMLRNRTIEERKQNAEDKMVRSLLYGNNFDLEKLKEILPFFHHQLSYRLIIIQNSNHNLIVNENYRSEIQLQLVMLLKSKLKQHGLTSAISIGKDETAIIAFYIDSKNATFELNSFSHTIQTIKRINEENLFDGRSCSFGISRPNTDILALSKSYNEAKEVLLLKQSNVASSIFYERIGVYQFLINQTKKNVQFVEDYLQPLILYDNQTNSELLKTLEIYLNCSCAKKETSEQLFIVRQTLYHRLHKIKELLGADYLEPNNRLALELAIKTKHLLSVEKVNGKQK